MEYKNMKTGAIISTECVISGGDWVAIDDSNGDVPMNDPMDDADDSSDDRDELTVAELKQALTDKGIDYPNKAKKSELLALLNGE